MMNRKQRHSLQTRLTLVYGASILAIGLAFVSLSTLFLAILAGAMNARMHTTQTRIYSVVERARAHTGSLAAIENEVRRALTTPGVRVLVLDRRTRRFYNGGPPFRLEGPHRDDRLHHGPRPVFLAFLLGIEPTRETVGDITVALFPDPNELGSPLIAYAVEMLVLGSGVIAAAALVGRVLTVRALQPVADVQTALGSLADGRFTLQEIETIEDSEIGDLAIAFNRAAARVNEAIDQREDDRLRMRRFIADAGHELRTPLTVIMGHVDLLKVDLVHDRATLAKIYHAISSEGMRMRTLVNNLTILAAFDEEVPSIPELFEIGALLDEIIDSSAPIDPEHRVVLHAPGDCLVLAVSKDLREAFANLLSNALKYAPQGRIDVVVSATHDSVVISVDDEGPGIAAEDLPHVYERFFRGGTNRDVEGSGLGLAIVSRAIARSGGTFEVRNRVPCGLTAGVTLPRITLD